MRLQTGARADREQWSVHLKAALPWASVNGRLRFNVELVGAADSALIVHLAVDPPKGGPPSELWWAHLPDSERIILQDAEAFVDREHGGIAPCSTRSSAIRSSPVA
jgi:hypothetical protein